MEMCEINQHANYIQEAVQALCNVLEKHYPGITNKAYEKGDDNWTFSQRMLMAVNIELMLAGVINHL